LRKTVRSTSSDGGRRGWRRVRMRVRVAGWRREVAVAIRLHLREVSVAVRRVGVVVVVFCVVNGGRERRVDGERWRLLILAG
jgi:hypothetical protein